MDTQQVIKTWNLVVDVERCENCNNCFMADKDEYCGNSFPGYSEEQPRHGHRWINIQRRERGSGSLVDVAYMPTMCNQCKDAPCVKAAKNGEIYQRDDGIVIIDPLKAKGQERLVKSCPYGHIWWNDELELPQKWYFDAHLLDNGWKEPRCVQSCATGALQAIKVSDEEMLAKVRQENLEVLNPEFGTNPRIWYRNLYRFNKQHLAGSVVAKVDGVVDCVKSATVTLSQQDTVIAELQTDYFGDFKFDKLETSTEPYQLTVSHEYGRYHCEVDLQNSINLGVLTLE
ncbi:4Fe-4S dicluster domain-containing protein [Vibrio hippocampi]|uniref:Pyrogallol hydroxytransferase small subunit n=1 Tax=Vibrio hippocampi TaxID=654686 RepID=A0ABN8DL75_9VIBR|nr:4Fe-4S dicluster domain-containing protein [Vibrio hippocampi]CAH0529518.1 Pyrogallol hydroxytransferase small subunit [Vibrio hippocampi]